jgi:hypothetical protein
LYRLSVEIQSRSGKRLVRYEENFRAIQARSDLRLSKSFGTLTPGETGYLRVDNYGTVPASYGFGYRLWNDRGEEIPVETFFPNILLALDPGEAGACFRFKVPPELPPGTYRIGASASDTLRKKVLLFTSVQIEPS